MKPEQIALIMMQKLTPVQQQALYIWYQQQQTVAEATTCNKVRATISKICQKNQYHYQNIYTLYV